MARFNTTRHRTQRYVLRRKARDLLDAGVRPRRGKDGKLVLMIDGRHYVLPAGLC